ncbi:thymidylate synthase [Candidatus Omnitrophota bacterium]
MKPYGIPTITVEKDTLPAAWEESVIRTWNEGISIKTEYDKSSDPPSKDVTMIMIVKYPFQEPRIHRAFPGGLGDLEVYRQEVVDGVHDSWIAPSQGKWTYTYHQRLFSYGIEGELIDQMEYIVDKLCESGYSRRAQAITWNPKLDSVTDDPPCLQRVWFRIDEQEGKFFLNMNTHWRSRDAFKAAFMNIFALTDLQRYIAERISERTKKPLEIGRYVDITDSYHIYGSYYDDFKGFLDIVEKRDFKSRVWDSSFAEPFFDEARKKLEAEKDTTKI